jgi:hypothetical protein
MPKFVGKSGGFTKESEDLPSGYVKIAIEHAHKHSGFSHEKW